MANFSRKEGDIIHQTLSFTYYKLYCKWNPYWFIDLRDLYVQTYIKIFFSNIFFYFSGVTLHSELKKTSIIKSMKIVKSISTYCIFKGVVARNAFQLEFSELLFFLFNGLNYIYRASIWKNFNFLPCSLKKIKTWKSYFCDIHMLFV